MTCVFQGARSRRAAARASPGRRWVAAAQIQAESIAVPAGGVLTGAAPGAHTHHLRSGRCLHLRHHRSGELGFELHIKALSSLLLPLHVLSSLLCGAFMD